MEHQIAQADRFNAEVRERFGILPNFFCTAASAPGLIEKMWGFAKSGYLDNPLPSLFKERLFVHLSRFCEIRYCIVRHVGFLIGEGKPAGDAAAVPQTVEQVLSLLTNPVPTAEKLEQVLIRLETQDRSETMPARDTPLERDLFDALTILFVAPQRAERARHAITAAMGETMFELLTAFLAFVRTAHYWTETHPTLQFEADMVAVMKRHPELANLLLDGSDAQWARSSEVLQRALEDLRYTAGTLRATEDRFRAFVTATSNVVFRMSPDWREMRHLDGRGFIVDTISPCDNWLDVYIPADDQAHVSSVAAEAVRSKSVFELEHRVRRVDGTWAWSLSRAVPLLDDKGEITEWFGAARDITARRNVEEALRDGDRRKNEFLATLAHELRNPLAPLRHGLEIAKRLSTPDASLQRTIGMMDRQLKQLVHLVDDLLDVGRISTGKIELRQEQVSLRKVLAASAESCRAAIDEHGHTFFVESGADDLFVAGDFDRLTQVFSNLLSNAAKYMDRGGRIELRVARKMEEAVISVSDTGIGIPATDLPHVFELFSQVSAHRGRAEGGLGIGLSLVRNLVELHQGSVSATSAGIGRGSTFDVRLPLVEPAQVPQDHESAAYGLSQVTRHRVLVVDDNRDAATSLAMLLSEMGQEVDTAFGGQDGVAKAEAMHPDLVFLDLGMPLMDGIDAAKHLRALPRGKDITLVALTGWGQEHDHQRTRAAGFDRHLLKPIDVAELDKLLARPVG
ncbi:MAG TPA: ATP-binding protein [Steroidobacteraceae bacterium]|nr:ATP-binding protein [Steroidobacteraceae bacterium]